MTNTLYPSPVKLTADDNDAVIGLLELHVAGQATEDKIKAFFTTHASAALQAQPRHPGAGSHAYGHWGTQGDLEVFAHSAAGKMSVHSIAKGSYMLPIDGYKGAIWADFDPSTGKVEFTPIGTAEGRFNGIAYKPGAAAREAIDHQITAHVTGRCAHDHSQIHHKHG